MKGLIALIIIMCVGCKANSMAVNEQSFAPGYTPGPRALVYKTRKDYSNLVPVILSDDKTTIVSYPHPSDLQTGNRLQLPTPLHKDYLLDNRGIGRNVAFLKLTYQQYAKLKQLPSLKALYAMIADKDPLTELYDCGNKNAFTHITEQLNTIIDSGKLKATFRAIK